MKRRPLLDRLGLALPIIQAPMAGVSTPALAAAVSRAGGLGSLGLGATTAQGARSLVEATRALHDGPLNLNLFCHRPAVADAGREAAWIERFREHFAGFGAPPPTALREIYRSFSGDQAMLAALLDLRPSVVSFHFGLPPESVIQALKSAGVLLMASATNLLEARAIANAGVDAVIAQGWEAGGHRGVFDPEQSDDQLGVLALTALLVQELDVPVIAAGGVMNGAGIAAVLRLGAAAAQLGTAFVVTEESGADAGYRTAMRSDAAHHTVMTRAISGRPARSLANRFTGLGLAAPEVDVPDYPVAYDLAKALHAAAAAGGEAGFGAQWAGQGAPLARPMSAAALMETLTRELAEAS